MFKKCLKIAPKKESEIIIKMSKKLEQNCCQVDQDVDQCNSDLSRKRQGERRQQQRLRDLAMTVQVV